MMQLRVISVKGIYDLNIYDMKIPHVMQLLSVNFFDKIQRLQFNAASSFKRKLIKINVKDAVIKI